MLKKDAEIRRDVGNKKKTWFEISIYRRKLIATKLKNNRSLEYAISIKKKLGKKIKCFWIVGVFELFNPELNDKQILTGEKIRFQ